MMKRVWIWLILMMIGLFGLAGCGSKEAPSTTAVEIPTDSNVSEPVKAATLPALQAAASATVPAAELKPVPVGGGGAFDLKQPASGLDALASYSQHYMARFEGQKDGSTFTSSTAITHTVQREPAAELSALQSLDQGGDPVQVWMLKLGGAGYFQESSESSCQGFDLASLQDTGAVPDPASLLPLVFGAQPSGEETLGDVTAVRYNFDQHALAQYQAAKATGSVWVAKEGGWVVKYTLEVTAPKDVLGAGLEGKQSWTYEVSPTAPAQDLSLPAGCTAVLLDFPVSSGAQAVERMSGSLVYTTAESVEAVKAYYTETLAGLGWKIKDMFPATASGATLNFILPEGATQKIAAIQLQTSGSQTDVTVVVFEETLPSETP